MKKRMSNIESIYEPLQKELNGDLYTDDLQRILYATDASSYREIPVAVTRPRDKDDIKKIIHFAASTGGSVIPRGAGTSLAGQVVGPGIVMDISKYLTRILDFNPGERWVIVEPGVILADLNKFLQPHGLMFGPETSTASRCCMGGMLGNNSCGLHSLIYGSVRDHILEAEVILSDGSEVTFGEISTAEFKAKCNGDTALLETSIYRNLDQMLSDKTISDEIRREFPDPRLKRRNNGYAIDILLETDPFTGNGKKINVCKLLAGSEGTLAFTTKMKLNLIPVKNMKTGLVCAHFSSLQDAVKANIIALRHNPAAIELIDDYILDCTKDNIEQNKNRFFIQGNPKIILLIEFLRDNFEEIEKVYSELKKELKAAGYGYHFPLFTADEEIFKVWELRRAGLGVLLNIPGDRRSVQVIEDTSVLPEKYPDYIAEFEDVLKKYDLNCAYYAHIATGELHLSPLLNLKDQGDIDIYYSLAADIAHLVKKYRGSLSGEHGDGRLRGEFIPIILGAKNYGTLKELKKTWDPAGVFNPGKITDTPSIKENLRYLVDRQAKTFKTTFEYPERDGFLYSVEKCSGSGDCRKNSIIGGTMCPTFMVTRDEDKSTRGRANILREFLTRSTRENPFDHTEIYQVMDLCLSCKACKSECPSNVDMTRFKAEFLQNWYEIHGVPLRSWLVGYLPRLNKIGMRFRPVTNWLTSKDMFKQAIGFAPGRAIPPLSGTTLRAWYNKRIKDIRKKSEIKKRVCIFADEFTNFNESDIGAKSVLLLEKLGYEVIIPYHKESGRTLLSKGLLKSAKKVAEENVLLLRDVVSQDSPLIGIEPSAILSFRDEYPEIVDINLRKDAKMIAANSFLFDEFISKEAEDGKINSGMFTAGQKQLRLHGHCQQKAIASTASLKRMLSIPVNYIVDEIPCGCCGMAGSFGYEKEHYELSMKIGEMVLFPEVRNCPPDTVVVAPGTSCRHHIFDATGRKVLHPAEVLFDALII
jgi:FAD/FMN-containing dehydrogenase/Fe-S oxidoreductase